MSKKEKVIQLLEISTDQLYWHLLNYCELLLKEQRKLNVHLSLNKACQEFRSTRTKYDRYGFVEFKKSDLQTFYDKINKIPFVNSETVNLLKNDLLISLENFNKYYDEETGVRKNDPIK